MFTGFGLAPGMAAAPEGGRPLLLTGLRLFDGKSLRLRDDVDILIEGEKIAALPLRGQGPPEAEQVDCGDRTVIPGLIDSHWHSTLTSVSEITALTADPAYLHLVAAREAGDTLLRGFTTIRDPGGPSFGLKRAIDEGIVAGPRIFPSGAMISQTSGHGDFRLPYEIPRDPRDGLGQAERLGAAIIADGTDAVLERVREQLAKGASQIKMMAGGGVTSLYDSIDIL
jgi:imidazolonepropionase-like amidohydrolase